MFVLLIRRRRSAAGTVVSEIARFAAGSGTECALADGRGRTARVAVDRRLASMWFGFSIRPEGWTLPSSWDPIAGDYRTRDGWIRLHTNAPHHRRAALAVLGAPDEKKAVAEATEDQSEVIEETDWGPARRLRFPLSVAGTAPGFERPASALRSASAQWSVR